MITFIPSSYDQLSDAFFGAWFDLWCDSPDDVDPADAFATYCAF